MLPGKKKEGENEDIKKYLKKMHSYELWSMMILVGKKCTYVEL